MKLVGFGSMVYGVCYDVSAFGNYFVFIKGDGKKCKQCRYTKRLQGVSLTVNLTLKLVMTVTLTVDTGGEYIH